MELMRRMLLTLFPRGRAWRLPGYWQVIVAGWSYGLSEVKEFLYNIKAQKHPQSATQALTDWQDVLGVRLDTRLSVSQQQDQLEVLDSTTGGQSLGYLNSVLQRVYPRCWLERLPANDVLGNREALCGLASCVGDVIRDDQGNVLGSSRFSYYVKGHALANEEAGLRDILARLAPAHMQAIWLVEFIEKKGE